MDSDQAKSKSRWWQFGLRRLLFVVLLLAVAVRATRHIFFGFGFGGGDWYILLRWDDSTLLDMDTLEDEFGPAVWP